MPNTPDVPRKVVRTESAKAHYSSINVWYHNDFQEVATQTDRIDGSHTKDVSIHSIHSTKKCSKNIETYHKLPKTFKL